jgi:hypothetical protein
MTIPAQQFRHLFTQTVIDVWREKLTATEFLRSFFPEKFSRTKYVSIEVQRGTEKIAVDVKRHSDGNYNTFDLSTEKIFEPPMFDEFLVVNQHHLYDAAIRDQSPGAFADLANAIAEDLFILEQKINRAYEKYCADILETGIVQLQNYTNIDFKRKAGSLVDFGAGSYWATSSVDPFAQIGTGCTFLRKTGKAQGGVFNMIVGSEAWADLLTNQTFIDRENMTNLSLDAIRPPQRNSTGANFMGELTAGPYKVRVWTYDEYYDNASNVSTPYVNPKKFVLLPENPRFVMSYGVVPQLIENGTIPQQGKFLVQEFIDPKKTSHEMHIKSAGVPIPVSVDQIFTGQVVAP